jgi:sulfoacetaldehyde dehydrogenase
MGEDILKLVERARAAQEQIEFWSQERVDDGCAVGGSFSVRTPKHARSPGRDRHGGLRGQVNKHQKKTLGTLRDLHGLKTVGVIEENKEKGLLKFAKPVGVIGALTPVTNASSTITVNGLPILKTRNAVIFAPHPKAKATCEMICEFMRQGLRLVGAPEDLVLNIKEPTVEVTQELMRHVDLIVATGGSAMVKVAYSSGTPAYGVGAGNSVVVVDETAALKESAKRFTRENI